MVAAHQQPGHVGYDQPQEADRANDGGKARGHKHGEQGDQKPGPVQVDAQAQDGLVGKGKEVAPLRRKAAQGQRGHSIDQ